VTGCSGSWCCCLVSYLTYFWGSCLGCQFFQLMPVLSAFSSSWKLKGFSVLFKSLNYQSVLIAILALYLKFKLDFDEDTSTAIFHAFIALYGFFSIIGAILADQYLGKFKAILWTSFVYVLGHLIFPLISIPVLRLPERYEFEIYWKHGA